MRVLRLGILGCGAVVESYHLPAALRCKKIAISYLVDKNTELAQKLKRRYDLDCEISEEVEPLAGRVARRRDILLEA